MGGNSIKGYSGPEHEVAGPPWSRTSTPAHPSPPVVKNAILLSGCGICNAGLSPGVLQAFNAHNAHCHTRTLHAQVFHAPWQVGAPRLPPTPGPSRNNCSTRCHMHAASHDSHNASLVLNQPSLALSRTPCLPPTPHTQAITTPKHLSCPCKPQRGPLPLAALRETPSRPFGRCA